MRTTSVIISSLLAAGASGVQARPFFGNPADLAPRSLNEVTSNLDKQAHGPEDALHMAGDSVIKPVNNGICKDVLVNGLLTQRCQKDGSTASAAGNDKKTTNTSNNSNQTSGSPHCNDERINGLNVKLNTAAAHIVQLKKSIQLLQTRYNTVERDFNNIDKLDQDLKQLRATSQANEDEIKGYRHQIIDFEQKMKEYEHRILELKQNNDKTHTVSATPGHLVTRGTIHATDDADLHISGIAAEVCVDVVINGVLSKKCHPRDETPNENNGSSLSDGSSPSEDSPDCQDKVYGPLLARIDILVLQGKGLEGDLKTWKDKVSKVEGENVHLLKLQTQIKTLKGKIQKDEKDISNFKHKIVDYEHKTAQYERKIIDLEHNKDNSHSVVITPDHIIHRRSNILAVDADVNVGVNGGRIYKDGKGDFHHLEHGVNKDGKIISNGLQKDGKTMDKGLHNTGSDVDDFSHYEGKVVDYTLHKDGKALDKDLHNDGKALDGDLHKGGKALDGELHKLGGSGSSDLDKLLSLDYDGETLDSLLHKVAGILSKRDAVDVEKTFAPSRGF